MTYNLHKDELPGCFFFLFHTWMSIQIFSLFKVSILPPFEPRDKSQYDMQINYPAHQACVSTFSHSPVV